MAAVTKNEDGKKAMPDEDLPNEAEGGDDEKSSNESNDRARANEPKAKPARSGNFFTLYKKGQGYWTRMGTAIGAAFIGVMVSIEIYNQVPTILPSSDDRLNHKISAIIAAVFLAGYSFLVFWYTNKPSTVDFLIATDSEMKKVNWTTRQELIGSTKVVIIFMFLIAAYLFFCDQIFNGFFRLVHVLE